MSDTIELKAAMRSDSGTSSARGLRRQGKIPAILYGADGDSQAIAFDAKILTQHAHRAGFMSTLISIKLDGKTVRAIPRQAQRHPLNGQILHMDFMRLSKNSRIDVEVNVHFTNEELSPGLKRGGVLNIVRHEVELSCPAEAIPDELIANLEGLEIGDSIHISHIQLPENVNPTITDRDFTVATIAAPAAVRSEESEDQEAEEGEDEKTDDDKDKDKDKDDKDGGD